LLTEFAADLTLDDMSRNVPDISKRETSTTR